MMINTTSGTVSTVKVTPASYFLMRVPNAGDTWTYYYINNVSRTDAVQTTADGGSAWTSQAYTVDAHLRQFSGNDTLYYFTAACDTLGNCGNSSVTSQEIGAGLLPPSGLDVLSPVGASYEDGDAVPINYTAASAFDGLSIVKYNITLADMNRSYVKTIAANNGLNLNYTWTANVSYTGTYLVLVYAWDSGEQFDYDESEEFNITIESVPPANETAANGTTVNVNVTVNTNVTVNNTNINNNNVNITVNNTNVNNNNVTVNNTNINNNNINITVNVNTSTTINNTITSVSNASVGGFTFQTSHAQQQQSAAQAGNPLAGLPVGQPFKGNAMTSTAANVFSFSGLNGAILPNILTLLIIGIACGVGLTILRGAKE